MGVCPSRAGRGPAASAAPLARGSVAAPSVVADKSTPDTRSPLSRRAEAPLSGSRSAKLQQRQQQPQPQHSSVPVPVGSQLVANEPQWMQHISSKFDEGAASRGRGGLTSGASHAAQSQVREVHGARALAKTSAAADSVQQQVATGNQAGVVTLQTGDYFRLLKETPIAAGSEAGGLNRNRRKVDGREPTLTRPAGIGAPSAVQGSVTSANIAVSSEPASQSGLLNRTPLQAFARELANLGHNADDGGDADASAADALNTNNLANGSSGGIRSRGNAAWQDDTWVDSWAADQNLSEVVYWSDDDAQHINARLLPGVMMSTASAHPLGRLTRETLAGAAARGYVMQDLSPELDQKVSQILLQLTRLGDIKRHLVQGSKRPLILGLREVQRAVNRSQAACVVVSPDIELTPGAAPGSAEIRVREILASAYEREIPVVFALSRARMARAIAKTLPLQISVVAMSDVRGVRVALNEALELAKDLQSVWLARRVAQ